MTINHLPYPLPAGGQAIVFCGTWLTVDFWSLYEEHHAAGFSDAMKHSRPRSPYPTGPCTMEDQVRIKDCETCPLSCQPASVGCGRQNRMHPSHGICGVP